MREWSMRRKLYLYPALLKELPELDDQIRMERDKVFTAYGGASYVLTGMPSGSGPSDPCGNTVVNQVLPGWERYNALCLRRREKQQVAIEVEQYLDSLDALELAVIKLRYFSRMTWQEISDSEYISRSTVIRLHASATGKCKVGTF